MLSIAQQNSSPGSMVGIQLNSYQYSNGDVVPLYAISNCYGGTSAAGDEGCGVMEPWLFEGVQEFTATINSGASTGATSITTNPPSR